MLKVKLQCHIPYNIIKVLLFVEFYKTVLFGTIKTHINGLWNANQVELYTFVLKICNTIILVCTQSKIETPKYFKITLLYFQKFISNGNFLTSN